MKLLGIQRHRTTAYHPQANGLVERFHRHFKEGLKARMTGNNWVNEFPIVLLGISTTMKKDLSCSSADLDNHGSNLICIPATSHHAISAVHSHHVARF